MSIVPLTHCCRMLGIDAKTLRQWCVAANLSVHTHPTDGRIRGLMMEQVQQLAHVHERPIKLEATPSLLPGLAQQHAHLAPLQSDPELVDKLASLEATVTTLQQQVTGLALELLQERDRRLLALEALLVQSRQPTSSPEIPATLADPATTSPQRQLHPAELQARSRALAVIAYEVDGSYVSIDPKQGELHFPAHSPEWFEWLACLSSFRFVGKLGRFTAYRKGGYRHPSRGWAAHRFFHNYTYKQYLGITPSLTLDRLEQVAADLQARIASL